MSGVVAGCPFCAVPGDQIILESDHVLAFWQPSSFTPGQAIICTRRHIEDWFALDPAAQSDLLEMMTLVQQEITARHSVARVSLQLSSGSRAFGQPGHLHVYLTPVGSEQDAPEDLYQPTGMTRYRIEEPAQVYDPIPQPHIVQQEALDALVATREAGNTRGLVVLATGLGKTWLSAFDSNRPEFRRILYVAHREEILDQAHATFARIHPDATLGYYTGPRKDPDADILFASVQTIGRAAHLDRFTPEHFDYVIIDEFHHAAADSYRRILDHVQPNFLLGLTATPERMDGQDLLALCGNNLVYRCDLREAIERNLLVPFHYYGVPDNVDYEHIPWRSGKFDEETLTASLATQARAENALEQYQKHAGNRTLAFCVTIAHANFMNQFFASRGYRCVVVHSGPESAPRRESLKQLEAGELDIIFSIDMFNEGVDLPEVDTVMMLRPTESPVIWKQQLGRGLRKAPGKDQLTVIDYIGNHQIFLNRIESLAELSARPGEMNIAEALVQFELGQMELPPGCEVTYDLQSIEIFRGLLPVGNDELRAEQYYRRFREDYGVRPRASEMFHAGHDLKAIRELYGSWFRFVEYMGDASEIESLLLRTQEHFLSMLERTSMSKCYKMLVLLVMIEQDQLPGAISLERLTTSIAEMAKHWPAVQQDFGPSVDHHSQLQRLIRDNPLRVWSVGKATEGVDYFELDGDEFRTTSLLEFPDQRQRKTFQEAALELVEWRLAQYFARSSQNRAESIIGNVSHANGRPMIFLPDRSKNPGIPEGPMRVIAGDAEYEAQFVKIAVNVVRDLESGENRLPDILRHWFGANAGQPGTGNRVRFELKSDAYEMMPIGGNQQRVGPWREYLRKDIPPLFGLTFSESRWNQGIIFQENHLILLVTLEKAGQSQHHQYDDSFLSPELFQWQSQNRTTQLSNIGQAIRYNDQQGVDVHLFVRKRGKTGQGKAAPFYYCGELTFIRWEGEQPITVWWRLSSPVPPDLHDEMLIENLKGPS